MEWHEKTLQTYNTSAEQLAEYFQGIGPRTDDIERGLTLAHGADDARVVEIGCGDGRDAVEINKRVGWYEGVDPSASLLAIARQRLPNASFVEAHATSYTYPQRLNAIFAFASLLHVSRDILPAVFMKGHEALTDGGIYYISMKERPEYTEEVKNDDYGQRMFYFYNSNDVKRLAGPGFKPVYETHQTIGHTDWFTLALEKC
ncbi:MAG: class I SAM-dependent methyltransferase [Patescibacteria group bacterium]|nr:class I SAM-dependent methyltransferase [Patescibacteria group bacterium]